MSYVYLTASERVKIETYLQLGFYIQKIAGSLFQEEGPSFKTATTDHRKEFSSHERIREALGLPMYFANPHYSSKSGSNENANGLLRKFFLKGTDFGKVSRSEIAQALT